MSSSASSTSKKIDRASRRQARIDVGESWSSRIYKYAVTNWSLLTKVLGAISIAAFSFALYQSGEMGIKNLINVKADVLKDVIFGDYPNIFYCHQGSTEEPNVPPMFSELNKLRGTKFGFAVVNCSQVLPSGKNMWDRFKLNRKIKPTIFGYTGWSKAKQATAENLKDLESMKSFVDVTLAPKATMISKGANLHKFCGFDKNNTTDARGVGETCIVLVKGTRFTRTNSDMEARLIRENPKLRVAMIDGSKHRLSFEDAETLSADLFAIKVHALRNGTHYLSMVNPLTWDYLSTFVSQAVGTPLLDYNADESSSIRLMKAGSKYFQKKAASSAKKGKESDALDAAEDIEDEMVTSKSNAPAGKTNEKQKKNKKSRNAAASSNSKSKNVNADTGSANEDSDRIPISPEKSAAAAAARAAAAAMRARNAKVNNDGTSASAGDTGDQQPTVTAGGTNSGGETLLADAKERERQKQEREFRRREQMERETRERLFDSSEDGDDNEDEEDGEQEDEEDDDNNEDIIDL